MEKMNKAYVGTVEKWSTAHLTNTPGEITSITFKDGTLRDNPWPFEPHAECYLVKKDDLDAYMARKESLEKTKGTPEWYLSNRIKQLEAENANLRDINKSLGEENSKLAEKQEELNEMINKFYGMCSAESELKAANEKLAAEVDELNKRISHLKVILEHDENRMAALITENNKLRGTYNELNSTVTYLRQKLAKYEGVQEVIDIRTTNDQDSYVLWWTGRNGDEHKLELVLVQNPMDEKMRREMDIYDRTRT